MIRVHVRYRSSPSFVATWAALYRRLTISVSGIPGGGTCKRLGVVGVSVGHGCRCFFSRRNRYRGTPRLLWLWLGNSCWCRCRRGWIVTRLLRWRHVFRGIVGGEPYVVALLSSAVIV